ncbi:MAG: polysaccharide lyase [Verrucomicrobiae bacterium]|nr:polysaccharide lyase [Verrucomicrobiae bacterium]
MKIPLVLAQVCCACAIVAGATGAASSSDPPLRDRAAQALRLACEYFDRYVSTEGGYLWTYSDDLQHRAGEQVAPATTVWVQPPGTPSVGLAFLRAYLATKDHYYLNLAKKAADCLRRGQLESGGWSYRIDFDPKDRSRWAYRVDGNVPSNKASNLSTLDDNTTQSALRFLILLDQTLGLKDAAVHEVVEYGLRKLLEAQYPNGAWPQRFTGPPDPSRYPIKKASYPQSWPKTFPAKNYYDCYTFNDYAICDMLSVMFLAAKVYQQSKYLTAAEKCADFILLAQMPDPQPAWAQQYDANMHPTWARKFEPPAITGGESQAILRTLLDVYQQTGNRKYLEPVPRALAYLKKSVLPDGQLARFYELQTNRPLYFTKDYQLTYDDSDLPTHYRFKVPNSLGRIEARYQQLLKADATQLARLRSVDEWKPSRPNPAEVQRVIAALDEQGRWLEHAPHSRKPAHPHGKIISTATFIRNVGILADFLAR